MQSGASSNIITEEKFCNRGTNKPPRKYVQLYLRGDMYKADLLSNQPSGYLIKI